MYVGYYHLYGGFDEDVSAAQVAGSDLDKVKQWLMDEHDIEDAEWIGSPDGPGSLFSRTRPELHVTEVEVLD